MARKITGYVKLEIPAGKANPSPPIGPALGQAGVNIMEFCKAFNAQTQALEPGARVPVLITVYGDRSFTFVVKSPTASYQIKKMAKLEKGSGTTGKGYVGKLTMKQVRQIAEAKIKDTNAGSVEAALKSIAGTARSMGVEVVEG